MNLDAVDKKLLNLVQSQFPMVAESYKEIGMKLGVTTILCLQDSPTCRPPQAIYTS